MVEVKLNNSNEKIKKKNKKVYGIGINDLNEPVYINSIPIRVYEVWTGMLKRCYDNKYIAKQPTYSKCSVIDSWLYLSNFKEWFDKQYKPEIMKDWQLDKDILVPGNKIYSPNTCCFIPQEINLLFITSKNIRGKYPIGVYYDKKHKSYKAYIRKYGKLVHIGYYNESIDAFYAYKKEKELYIKELANKYKNIIDSKVYEAMLKYEVKIED